MPIVIVALLLTAGCSALTVLCLAPFHDSPRALLASWVQIPRPDSGFALWRDYGVLLALVAAANVLLVIGICRVRASCSVNLLVPTQPAGVGRRLISLNEWIAILLFVAGITGLALVADAPFDPRLRPMFSNIDQQGVSVFERRDYLSFGALVVAVNAALLAAFVNMRNAVRKHTLDVILNSRTSSAFQDRIKDFQAAFPNTMRLTRITDDHLRTADAVKGEDDSDTAAQLTRAGLEAAKYLLNYYEFIAIGVYQHDLDESLVHSSMQIIVANTLAVTEVYVRERQANDPRAWIYLQWLAWRWRLEIPQSLVETVGS